MGAAIVVIPLAAMLLPIVLLVVAVVVDIIALLWMGCSYMRSEWSGRLTALGRALLFHPAHRTGIAAR
jgi:hypothetical protein